MTLRNMRAVKLTKKQRQIMEVIIKGNRCDEPANFSWVDMDQLLERLPYDTTKDSMHFSIRALVKRGLVEKGPTELRRGRKRRTFVPTSLALDSLTASPKAEPEIDEAENVVEYF